MGYRHFKDSQGIEWQTWDIVPRLAERRGQNRRRETSAAVAVVNERRRTDRRVVSGRRPVLSAGLDGGWLCFEATVQKRRLSPIPSDWLRCDDECLERYCKLAKPALRSSRAIDILTVADLPH